MNLFSQQTPKADPAKVNQVKAWVYERLELDSQVPISISQLRCTEPGCPPVETVFAVMTTPVRMYKIHRSIAEITYADLSMLRQG